MASRRRSKDVGSVSDVFGEGRWGSIFSAIMEGIEVAAGPQKRAVAQVSQFFSHFTRNALDQFGPMLLRPRPCSMEDCQEEAVRECEACGEVACMAHLHVSHLADGICDQCVRDLLELKGREYRPPVGRGASAQEVRKALRVLGLRPGASWTEVQRAHRRQAAENHPDRARTPAQRRRAEEKVKGINVAFDVLRRHYEKAAA